MPEDPLPADGAPPRSIRLDCAPDGWMVSLDERPALVTGDGDAAWRLALRLLAEDGVRSRLIVSSGPPAQARLGAHGGRRPHQSIKAVLE